MGLSAGPQTPPLQLKEQQSLSLLQLDISGRQQVTLLAQLLPAQQGWPLPQSPPG